MLEDEIVATPFTSANNGTTAFIQSRSGFDATINGDTRDFGAQNVMVRLTVGGDGIFLVHGKAVCCPR